MNYLTSEDVRNFMLDRTAADNELDMDLSFSPEEVADAMKRAAREANSVPPLIGNVDGTHLPGDTNIFLYATAEQLYLSKVQQLMRNDVEYTAGGISASASGTEIKHLKGLIKEFSQTWKQQWADQKRAINLRRFHYYGN